MKILSVIVGVIIGMSIPAKGEFLPVVGESTNGLRLETFLVWTNVQPDTPPVCIVNVRNVSTKTLAAFIDEPEHYIIRLWGPDGREIERKAGKGPTGVGRPSWETFTTNDVHQVTWFSVPETFPITNRGQYKLVVAVQVSIWPDGGKTTYRGKHTYFALPAVTNSFKIDSIPLISNSQTAPSLEQGRPNILSAASMTDQQKAQFLRDFSERFKPTVDKWIGVYNGRLPFASSDFKPDTFRMRTVGINGASFAYVFDINGIRFDVHDVNGKAKVCYMTANTEKETRRFSKEHPWIEAKLAVAKDDAFRLIKADIGTEITPEKVVVSAIAAAPAFNAGTHVTVKGHTSEASFDHGDDMELIFGSDGKLIYYMRHPSF